MTVHLVGAGPGDPGLITARGLELVRSCDALVVDDLVAPELVDEAPDDVLVVSRRGLDQAAVNQLLVDLGHQGLDVVRLKGGDPFVFGRGGEEAIALAEAGIPFEVVPGVSALSAVPAEVADDERLTGNLLKSPYRFRKHGQSGLEFSEVLPHIARHADRIASRLIAHGKDASTPAAVIARGTRPDGECASGSLGELAALAEGLPQPALIVIGDVVAVAARVAPTLAV